MNCNVINQLYLQKGGGLIIWLLLVWQLPMQAQHQQNGWVKETAIGVNVGTSVFLGELGLEISEGIQPRLFRATAGVFLEQDIAPNIKLKLAVNYASLYGNDALWEGSELFSSGWYRYYRNLNFKTNILSFDTGIAWHPFKNGQGIKQFSPYIWTGLGLLHFKPQAQYKNPSTGRNEWVDLQALSTEGQGFAAYPDRKPYKLWQLYIPVGIGVNYRLNDAWAIGLEGTHHLTFTDYIDDVSTSYINPSLFYENFDLNKAELAASLAQASTLIDPEGEFSQVTDVGEQRGNDSKNDAFFIWRFTLTHYLNTDNLGSNDRGGNTKCFEF